MTELLAPAGNFSMLNAAIQAKADSVYFGIKGLNMRAGAKNFSIKDLPEIAKLCHENNMRAYLAVNTIIYDHEMELLDNILRAAKENKIDAFLFHLELKNLLNEYRKELKSNDFDSEIWKKCKDKIKHITSEK